MSAAYVSRWRPKAGVWVLERVEEIGAEQGVIELERYRAARQKSKSPRAYAVRAKAPIV